MSRNGDSLHVSQKQFLLLNDVTDRRYPVPITVVREDRVESVLLEGRETQIGFMGFRKLNHMNTGFYRSLYADELLDHVLKHAGSASRIDRWGIANDAFAFLLSGLYDLNRYSRVVDALSQDTSFMLSDEISSQLVRLWLVCGDSVLPLARRYFDQAISHLGLRPPEGGGEQGCTSGQGIRAHGRIDNRPGCGQGDRGHGGGHAEHRERGTPGHTYSVRQDHERFRYTLKDSCRGQDRGSGCEDNKRHGVAIWAGQVPGGLGPYQGGKDKEAGLLEVLRARGGGEPPRFQGANGHPRILGRGLPEEELRRGGQGQQDPGGGNTLCGPRPRHRWEPGCHRGQGHHRWDKEGPGGPGGAQEAEAEGQG
ncbi:hypothetical protein [Thermogymnomonas acidicola]|uniref:ERAP1-like C-terminal domain-containing protein n=1 Tax=Thermogymnomonas acidicola TaxID=399579 RepID=UPI001396BF67|nr:ERAP1-like C-terminal domain-containing protein [Thermogymnomonas acidicola]